MLTKNFLRSIIIISILFFSITISYLFLYPDDNKNDDSLSQSDGSLPYNVFYPDKTIELPDELTEISGISYYDKIL